MPQPAPHPPARQEIYRCTHAAATPLTSLLFSCALRLHCVTTGRACRHLLAQPAPCGTGRSQNSTEFLMRRRPVALPNCRSLPRLWSRSQAGAHSARTTRGGGSLLGAAEVHVVGAATAPRTRATGRQLLHVRIPHTHSQPPPPCPLKRQAPRGTHHFLSGEGSKLWLV